MKSEKKLLKEKRYRLWDYPGLLFRIYPLGTCMLAINRCLTALLPAAQTLVIAGIIDIITNRVSGTAFVSPGQAGLELMLTALVGVIVFSYLNGSISSYFTLKMAIRMGREFTTSLLKNVAALKYWNIENELI